VGSRIVTTYEVLSESYIPQNILHREKELGRLSNAINVVNTFVYGPTGAGKTLLIKKVIQDFNAKSSGMAIYIDCCLYQTTNAIFHEILLSMNTIVSSKSNYALTKRLKERVRRLDHGLSICLDHFERLKEIETVNRLLSLGVKLVIVSDSHETFRKLNSMGKANITNIIEIPSYSVDQALDILLDRTREALEGTAYSDETIRKIAQASSGNMTLCLNLLRALALKAEGEDKNSIDEVEWNYEVDCEDDSLSADERILVKILREQNSLASNTLYGFYSQRARHPKSRRSFRNYMQNLCVMGLVRNVGEKRGRVYEIVNGLFNCRHDERAELCARNKMAE
jgi:Cdc6-like AAA superfamily ATPase